MKLKSECAKCPFSNSERVCRNPDGRNPDFCPTVGKRELLDKAREVYHGEDAVFAEQAARQEASKSPNGIYNKPRIVELVEFCRRMGYKHLGLAFCGGLHQEAKQLSAILEINGFTVTSVMCKAGAVDCTWIGLDNPDGKHKSVCNPAGQAAVLNDAKTEFNIMLGLCVGHDSLFLKHSDAMCTVFAVKDRALANNPLGAIYNIDTSFKYLKKPLNFDDFN